MNAPFSLPPAASVTPEANLPPCLIVNPKSFRTSNGGLAARAAQLARAYGAEVIEAHEPVAITTALDALLARGLSRVFVLSGDGTVQAIVDHLAQRPPGSPLPQLLVLGGGRTNMTAGDVGGRGAVLDKLESALRRCREQRPFVVEERCLLRLEQAPAPPRHGFFVAAGLIDEAVRACHRHRDSGRGPLHQGHLSTAWYLTKLAVLALLGRSPLSSPQMDIAALGLGQLSGATRVLIATTLLHPEGLFNPYAARGAGSVRVTAVATRAPRFWRSLPRILLGRFSARLGLENGYLSGRCQELKVLGMSGYSLDGEEFDTDPQRPVLIRSGASLSFLRP